MENDKDWVEDVRRWYFNSSRATSLAADAKRRPMDVDAATLGYEAAHPALQAPSWQTPSGLGALR